MVKNLSKIVVPIKDSNNGDYRPFLNAKVHEGTITDEISKPNAPACFLGAWYHKVFSAKDSWLGIEGTITLGEFTPDINRYGFDGRVDFKRDLDSPSIYMGGHAISESDAGLGLMSGYTNKNDTDYEINYGTPKVAYRPFWRYIYNTVVDKNGNVERNNINSWNVSDPLDFDFYYFPGDKIKMQVYAPINDYLQLRIEVIETTKITKYKKIREELGVENPRVFLSPLFYSEGHGRTLAEFKRVNSIDQYGNEGFLVSETKATMLKSIWENTYLYRNINGEIVKVPFTKERRTTMSCPNIESFNVIEVGDTGEEINIRPLYDINKRK